MGPPDTPSVGFAALSACRPSPDRYPPYHAEMEDQAVAFDFEISGGVRFGEWLHEVIGQNAFYEVNGFMPDQVRRVADCLQARRPERDHLIVKVPWLRAFNAFTAPGRYIYFSRRLLERCPTDETVAFVIAHEIAHHDLGHLRLFTGPFSRHAAKIAGADLMVLFFRILQKRIYSVQWETAADDHAINLCVSAGYDGRKCLRLFDVLERWALDYGDLDAVYGLDQDDERELSPEATLITKARIVAWQRRRGYLPIQDRTALARDRLAAIPGRASA
jgi:hypothetical protein